jgi:hypothetical protein
MLDSALFESPVNNKALQEHLEHLRRRSVVNFQDPADQSVKKD